MFSCQCGGERRGICTGGCREQQHPLGGVGSVAVSVQQPCLGFLEFLLCQALGSRLSPDKPCESDVTKCFPSDSLRDLCLCSCTGVSKSTA